MALGTWGLGANGYGPIDSARVEATVQRALESGVTTFDVAPSWGTIEHTVATVVGARRDEVQYVTRANSVMALRVVESCETSLRNLKTDHLDVLLLNHPPETEVNNETLTQALVTLKSAGKIRAWGVSTSKSSVARAALDRGVDVLCVPHNVLASDLLMDIAPDLALRETGVLAHSPLAYGLLADAWKRDHVFGTQDHRRRRWTSEGLNERLRHVEALRFLVHGSTKSLADAAIKFVLADSAVGSCIVGARSPAQIAEAALLANPPYLDDEDLVRIPQVLASLGV
ncbi:MAG: aldo/keto reductase [Sandaracinaceae bacterium]|nr:aldo/keto reductase [Sandaracinaceae bacterium]